MLTTSVTASMMPSAVATAPGVTIRSMQQACVDRDCPPARAGRLGSLLGPLLALVLVLVGWLGWSQPSHAGSATSVGDEQVRVLGHLPMRLSASDQREFVARTLELAKITRDQDGVISYSCNVDIEHQGSYLFDEVWPSEQVLAAHLETAHFKRWWAWVEPRLGGELEINLTATSNLHKFG